jgi:hypothetical protein
VVALVVVVVLSAAGCGSRTAKVFEASAPITTVPPPPPTTTSTTVPACPQPSVPDGAGVTQLATPNAANLAYSATPAGPAVGRLVERWGGPSTRPVLDQQNGWVQLRLATRPNGSTGWVPLTQVTLTTTSYRVVVSICQRSLTLFNAGAAVYSAPVGVGRPQWPTPVGPTYVDSVVATPKYQQYIYGPTVFILGLHSNVFTEFDGGDGTVALHGYPSDPGSTKGVMSSHGCVRASPDTINAVRAVPVGTPVDVIA